MEQQIPEKQSISMWTLSYRLKGMTLGLIVALGYCYFYLDYWSYKIIILAGILGYMLGWIVGRFFYTKN